MEPIIRPEQPGDLDQVRNVVEQAFGSPIEARLVGLIRASEHFVPELSLVAGSDGQIVGHIMLSYAHLDDGERTHRVLTLSPLSVRPDAQRKGVGTALILEALGRADARGEPLVLVEGDPRYYSRTGAIDARTAGITFDLPDWAPRDAGQIYRLGGYDAKIKGHVRYPPAFAEVAGD